jgi:hypothetical protein
MRGDYQKPKIICYGCGQEGHMKLDCPNKPAGGWPTLGGSKAGGGVPPTRGRNFGGNNNNNNNNNTNK